MKIENFTGDIRDSKSPLIIQQVNCQGAMNSGLAKNIRDKWPIVYDNYYQFVRSRTIKSALLGECQFVDVSETQKVVNVFGQLYYGYDGKKYTSYDAIDSAFKKLANYVSTNNIRSIAIPYNFGSGRGGADWNVVKEIIVSAFKDTYVTIEIWNFID